MTTTVTGRSCSHTAGMLASSTSKTATSSVSPPRHADLSSRADATPRDRFDPRAVGQYPLSLGLEDRDDHLGRRGLPVRPRDDDDAFGQLRGEAADHLRVDALGHESGQRRTAAAGEPAETEHGLADAIGDDDARAERTFGAELPLRGVNE